MTADPLVNFLSNWLPLQCVMCQATLIDENGARLDLSIRGRCPKCALPLLRNAVYQEQMAANQQAASTGQHAPLFRIGLGQIGSAAAPYSRWQRIRSWILRQWRKLA